MTPDEAVEAALAALFPDRETVSGFTRAVQEPTIRAILEAAAPHLMAEATNIIREMVDAEDCRFDHHGGCQAHGYLDLRIGEMCPQLQAKAWIYNQTESAK